MMPPPTAILPTYARADLCFERGERAWLIASGGERYLDFASGIAVTALGHAHPHLVQALQTQAEKIWHTSNLFRIEAQERLAERLAAASFAERVFFANSGAEAVECGIKMARKYHAAIGAPARYRLIVLEGAFHGRTLATIAAGGQPKHTEGFGPLVDGFDRVAVGDLEAVKRAIGPETAGILVEPVQGEGGVRVLPPEFLRGLRDLCDREGLLLLLDEVQTGMGRTGTLFACEHSGIEPDIMALAKGLGGGFPVGACLATEHAAQGMTAGSHGSTFGGNPLAMAVGNAVLDIILEPGFLDHARRAGLRLKQNLAALSDEFSDVISGVRGEGLMLGLECVSSNAELVEELRNQRLLSATAGDNVVRLLPPLIIGEEEIAFATEAIAEACRSSSTQQADAS